VTQSQHAFRTAQIRYKSAQAQEQARRQSLVQVSRLMAEVEPAAAGSRLDKATDWRRWLLTSMSAVLCGGFVIAVWPRRHALASAEEVHAVTRLPVVVVECASLN
jgi:hypothetical protein